MNHRLAGRVVAGALMVGVATGLVAGCTAGSSSSGAAAPAYESRGSGGGAGAPEAGERQDNAGAGGNKSEVSQPGVDRTLVRTATVELRVADVGETVDRARDVAAAEGGFAGQEEVREEYATLTLRIPSDRFDRALGELSALGEVTAREQTAEDVTEQVVDLDSRIATQRASVERVRALLAKATTVDEIVRIEGEVTSREADLESLQQRREALAGQVAMSTVTMRVARTTAAPPPPEEATGFFAGLSDGWHAFLDAGAGTLQVLGAMLPFLAVLAVPAVFALRWWRLNRRRRATAPVVQQP